MHIKVIQLLVLIIATASTAFIVNEKPVKLPKELTNNFAYIEKGEVIIEESTTIAGNFYISKYEISNKEYNEFLKSLQSQEKQQLLEKARIDTNGWSKVLFYFQPFSNYYHTHSAYGNYPVVNISKEAAEMYCTWLSDKLNKSDHHNSYEVRLPTREEWIRAARPVDIEAIYAWGTPYLRSNKGEFLCNFRYVGAENVSFDPEINEFEVKVLDRKIKKDGSSAFRENIVTAPVKSYISNAAGLYNMNGNVAEITSDGYACGGSWYTPGYDVRNESAIKFTGSSPAVGFRPVIIIKEK